MSTLYIECKMGVAGDMLSAALLELCPDRDRVIDTLNNMGLPGVSFGLDKSEKCGITGSHFSVFVDGEEEMSHDHHHHDDEHDHHHHHHHDEEHDHHHHHDEEHDHHHHHDDEHDHHHHHVHRSMKDIEHIVSHLNIPDEIKEDVISVYKLIAGAESSVHGKEVSEIHFHEVGSMDAIADITAVCLLMRELNPDKIVASPIHVGSGQVHCAHGILPVPAPATALLLKGIPTYSGDVKGELCTPTGAALLRYFSESFGAQPVMSIDKIGYGMGMKDFPQANCVRAMWSDSAAEKNEISNDGEKEDKSVSAYQNREVSNNPDKLTDTVTELNCNLDDMTPEEVGFATERLLLEGALDAFVTPIYMKKNRPATMLTVLCRESDKENIIKKIFKYTTTIGIRESICKRYILHRQENIENLDGEEVRVKKVSGYGVAREKAEYDDLVKIAQKNNISLRDARNKL